MKKNTYSCFIIFAILYALSVPLNAQIYARPLDIKFEAIQCTPKDTTKSYVMMSCTGINFKNLKTGKKINDTWYLEWSIPQHTSIVDGEIEEIFQTGGGTVIEGKDMLSFKFAPFPLYDRLEYCPIPQIHYPLETGKSWEWNTDIIPAAYPEQVQGEYGLEWKLKRDTAIVSCSYTVKGKKNWFFKREAMFIECYEIEATGKSKKGDTLLTAYFSDKYGFVFLDFETIDQRRYIFEMVQRIFVPKDRYWNRIEMYTKN